jgi:hypothetical protein
MYSVSKIVLAAVSALSVVAFASAAPIGATGADELAARGTNGGRNGWVSSFI